MQQEAPKSAEAIKEARRKQKHLEKRMDPNIFPMFVPLESMTMAA